MASHNILHLAIKNIEMNAYKHKRRLIQTIWSLLKTFVFVLRIEHTLRAGERENAKLRMVRITRQVHVFA